MAGPYDASAMASSRDSGRSGAITIGGGLPAAGWDGEDEAALLVALTDIHDLKLAEERLKLSASAFEVASEAVYIAFGRALGDVDGAWVDTHGAGAQRSDPKAGSAASYPYGHGPQGDVVRIKGNQLTRQ